MPAAARHSLLRYTLAMLVLVDLALWFAFVLHHWLAVGFWPAWGLGALLSLALTIRSMPYLDRLLKAGPAIQNDYFLGGTIP